MNQLPPNPESRRLAIACVALPLSLVALLCLGITGRVGVLLLSSQGLFLVAGLVVLFFVSLVSVIMTFHHWWLFRNFTKPGNLLAVWHYSEDEWREFQRRGEWGLAFAAAILLGVFLFASHETLFASTLSTVVSLTIYGALVVGAFHVARRHVKRTKPLCILSRWGFYDQGGRGYSYWHPPAVIESVGFVKKGKRYVLRVEYSSLRKPFSVEILVPLDREAEAARVCQLLSGEPGN